MSGNKPVSQASAPPATGVRVSWDALPPKVRAIIERYLDSTQIQAMSQTLGFSPGLAARLLTSDGRRVFVKAIGPEPNPSSVDFHRREVMISTMLPESGFVPQLLWSYDDVHDTGWVVLIFEDIEGTSPAQPWQNHELERVMQALSQMHDALSPSPVPAENLETARKRFETTIRGWHYLAEPPYASSMANEAWMPYLTQLVQMEKLAPQAVDGHSLLHFDLRADNMLLTEDRVWFVDWPHACMGAAWVDVVLFVPSVMMQCELDPDLILAQHSACRAADADAVNAVIAAIAGFFIHKSMMPPPPGLPTLREFQGAQGAAAWRWLSQRKGWT